MTALLVIRSSVWLATLRITPPQMSVPGYCGRTVNSQGNSGSHCKAAGNGIAVLAPACRRTYSCQNPPKYYLCQHQARCQDPTHDHDSEPAGKNHRHEKDKKGRDFQPPKDQEVDNAFHARAANARAQAQPP